MSRPESFTPFNFGINGATRSLAHADGYGEGLPDPVADAERWLERELRGNPAPPLLIVIGLGDGSLLHVLERQWPHTRVLTLEPDPQLAKTFLARQDWSHWRDTGRLVYLVGPEYAGAAEAWRIIPAEPDAHKVLVHPAVACANRDRAVDAARLVKRIVFGARANAEARRRFAPRYLTNTISNLPALSAGSDVRALEGFGRGVPAVVVGAGPSLDGSLDDLPKATDRALLFATDTALRPLLAAGVRPPLVVALDPSTANARHFQSLPDCAETWLVSESALDRSVADKFHGRTFWFRVAAHHPWPWLNELGIDVGQLEVWGSVLTAAFQVAVLAGCDPIVLVGADCAFTDGRPYCRGTTYEFDWAYSTANGETLERAWQVQMTRFEQLRVPDLRGGTTITAPHLQSFRDWMVSHAVRSGRRVINASRAGIFVGDGVEQSSLSEVLRVTRPLPSVSTLARMAPSTMGPARVARHLREVSRAIECDASSSPPVSHWADFSGEGHDPAALREALNEAARALESDRSESSRGNDSTIPWSRLAYWEVSRGILNELPEAIARFRAALIGVEPLPLLAPGINPSASDRVTLLACAVEVLDRICAAVADQNVDLAPPLDISSFGRLPLSDARCGFPERVMWAIRIFEGLLGKAWTGRVPTAKSAFFSAPVLLRDRSGTNDELVAHEAKHPHAIQACTVLALEWLQCALQLDRRSAPEVARLGHWLRAIGATHGWPGDDHTTHEIGAALVIEAKTEEWCSATDLPLNVGEGVLARVLTGAVRVSGHEPGGAARGTSQASAPGGRFVRFAQIGAMGTSASFGLRLPGSVPRTNARGSVLYDEALLLTPHILTDEGLPRSTVAHATPHGVVCVPLYGSETVLLREDGSGAPHLSWPRPIFAALPLGADGAVAWGTTNWSEPRSGYVMYRFSADDQVTIEELPFRPVAGTWWHGRLYWACFPSGVGSWAAGEEPTFAFPDLALIAVWPDGSDLVLHPCVRGEDGQLHRRLVTQGWRWHVGEIPAPAALGPHGAASGRAAGPGWTAIAHLEADVVILESVGGCRLSMTCYRPMKVAWVGQSLLVSTVDREVLLFEGLIDAVERWVDSR